MSNKSSIVTIMALISVLFILALANSPAIGDTWALLVAIDDYENVGIGDLNYTVNDLTRFYEALVGPKIGAVPSSNVYLMTSKSTGDSVPTDANILFRMENLAARVQSGDTFIFYFSGHGMTREGKQYLLSINSDPRSLTTLEQSAIPMERIQNLLSRIKARQILIILDACRNDPEKAKGDEDNPLTDGLARGFQIKPRQLANGLPGCTATFFASSLGERAYEWAEKESGVFSFYVVEGLSGTAADAENRVTLRGLADYVTKQVVSWSQEHLSPGKSQTPWLVSEGAADMVLAILPGKMQEDAEDEVVILKPKDKTAIVVVDSQGIETQISDVRFTFGHGWDFTQSFESITIQYLGGYVRIPFEYIERIDRVAKSDSENYETIMRVKLWYGQTVQGLVDEPYGGSPFLSGKVSSIGFSIPISEIASVFFPETMRRQADDKPQELDDQPKVTVKTGTGDEVLLWAPEIIWLGNSSDKSGEQWFSISLGRAQLRIALGNVQAIDVTQKGDTKHIVVHTKDGSKVEGTDAHGWSLAGDIELGLFLIPIESLTNATFKW